MASQHFLKGECAACRGHLEFPAEAAGRTIACPHCGQPTPLQPRADGRARAGKRFMVFGLLLVGLVALSARLLLAGKEKGVPIAVSATNQTAAPAMMPPPAAPMTPVAATPTPAASQLQSGETLTNEFIITAWQLEPTPGSSLVYVTGKVRNPTDRQRFGVKVRFALQDASGAIIGTATDYQSVIDPHGEWAFKAMVMESRTVQAQLSGISEDK